MHDSQVCAPFCTLHQLQCLAYNCCCWCLLQPWWVLQNAPSVSTSEDTFHSDCSAGNESTWFSPMLAWELQAL